MPRCSATESEDTDSADDFRLSYNATWKRRISFTLLLVGAAESLSCHDRDDRRVVLVSYQLRKLGKFALSYLDTFIH